MRNKSIVVLFVFILNSIITFAQLPLVGFQSVYTEPAQVTIPQISYDPLDPLGTITTHSTSTPKAVEYKLFKGYKYSNGWKKVTLKVNVSLKNPVCVAYQYGGNNIWYDAYNSYIYETSPQGDGTEIYNLFDYKVSIGGLGTVYF